MSHFPRILLVAGCAAVLGACSQSGNTATSASSAQLDTNAQKFGYAVGYDMGQQLKTAGDMIDLKSAEAGLQDSATGAKAKLDAKQRQEVKQATVQKLRKKELADRAKASKSNAGASAAFLAKMAKAPGVKTTDDGLEYKMERAGTGTPPTENDTVVINYKGSLPDGTVFDSSYKRGQPLTIAVDRVVPGFKEGLQLMKPGSKYMLYIPSELAYGEHGQGKVIGPNQALVFEIEMLKVLPAADSSSTSDTGTGAAATDKSSESGDK